MFLLRVCFLLLVLACLPSQAGPNRPIQTVAACKGLNKSNEPCLWWHQVDSKRCEGKCSKLVIYFAGGDQSCSLPPAYLDQYYGGVANAYAEAGYVFVCANIFQNTFTPAAAAVPYADEAERIDHLVRSITAHPKIRALWNGTKLLFSGISHGSTAPVIAMKQKKYDDQISWKGTKTTGACFLDGQYDPGYNRLFWLSPAQRESCAWFVGRTICGRYQGSFFCNPFLPNDGLSRDTIVDTLRKTPTIRPSDFAVANWKLVECGSKIGGCEVGAEADMLPAAPIAELCRQISSLPGHSCEFASEPEKSHEECGLAGVADRQCIGWFDGLK